MLPVAGVSGTLSQVRCGAARSRNSPSPPYSAFIIFLTSPNHSFGEFLAALRQHVGSGHRAREDRSTKHCDSVLTRHLRPSHFSCHTLLFLLESVPILFPLLHPSRLHQAR
jgi:hypothetical protein